MLPITHYLYLALAMFVLGLAGVLLRRALIPTLLGIGLMLAALMLWFSAYARMFVDGSGQVAALLIGLVGLCELAVIVAVSLRGLRAEQLQASAEADARAQAERSGG